MPLSQVYTFVLVCENCGTKVVVYKLFQLAASGEKTAVYVPELFVYPMYPYEFDSKTVADDVMTVDVCHLSVVLWAGLPPRVQIPSLLFFIIILGLTEILKEYGLIFGK